jgi:predicted esterase
LKSYFSNLKRIEGKTSVPVDFLLKNPKGSQLVILLHGFGQTAEKIFSLLGPSLPKDACVLALNGFFPMPQRIDNKYTVGFAWYFYDNFTDEYLVDEKPASVAIQSLVDELGFKGKKKVIVGYSQGGYLAPFAAERLKNVEKVVGISCQFLKDEIKTPNYLLDAIHGENDEVVDATIARKLHGELIKKGVKGTFTLVKNEGHKLTTSLLEPLKKLLE